jgi:hypothetical protein
MKVKMKNSKSPKISPKGPSGSKRLYNNNNKPSKQPSAPIIRIYDDSGYSGYYNFKKACYVFMSLLLFSIYCAGYVIISRTNDSNNKEKELEDQSDQNAFLFFTIVMSILTIGLIVDYYRNNILGWNILLVSNIVFIVLSLYLLGFGYKNIEESGNLGSLSIYCILIGIAVLIGLFLINFF